MGGGGQAAKCPVSQLARTLPLEGKDGPPILLLSRPGSTMGDSSPASPPRGGAAPGLPTHLSGGAEPETPQGRRGWKMSKRVGGSARLSLFLLQLPLVFTTPQLARQRTSKAWTRRVWSLAACTTICSLTHSFICSLLSFHKLPLAPPGQRGKRLEVGEWHTMSLEPISTSAQVCWAGKQQLAAFATGTTNKTTAGMLGLLDSQDLVSAQI